MFVLHTAVSIDNYVKKTMRDQVGLFFLLFFLHRQR